MRRNINSIAGLLALGMPSLDLLLGSHGHEPRRGYRPAGKFYDTVRPEVRKAWSLSPSDHEGRAKALGHKADA